MVETISNDDKKKEKNVWKKTLKIHKTFFYISIIIILNLHSKQQIPW